MKRKLANGAEDREVEFLGAVQQGHTAATNSHMLPPVSGACNKCPKNPKASKRKRFPRQTPESADGTFMVLMVIIVLELV